MKKNPVLFGKRPVVQPVPGDAPPIITPPASGATETPAAPNTNLPVPIAARSVSAPRGGQVPAFAAKTSLRATGAEEQGASEKTTAKVVFTDQKLETPEFMQAKETLIESLVNQVDLQQLEKLPKDVRRQKILELADPLMAQIEMPLTAAQQALLKTAFINEVLGFGPIEVLLADPDVADIMINGYKQVYIEKHGKLALSDVTFTSERHLINVIQKIVSQVGRRVDEKSPMVDARMPDGSRFNAIIPPLALDGSLVSIRKFKKNKMPLRDYVNFGSMNPEMVKFLEICGACRLNIVVSGGTGSGKTTLLNAISGHISHNERIVTIEDAAELQLQQPHVLRLETRPANMEGVGEITQRQLVKNALRMRPDRIILGEMRGDEIIDVLAAMNTGHDGSLATIHANNPRDCLSRMENLIMMTGLQMPLIAMRQQIASAVQMIVQIARMRDGVRRVTQIEEIVSIQSEVISTQTIFQFEPGPMGANGKLTGRYVATGIRPRFLSQVAYYGMETEMLDSLGLRQA